MHTQKVEANWRALRASFPYGLTRRLLISQICVFVMKRRHFTSCFNDNFLFLMRAIGAYLPADEDPLLYVIDASALETLPNEELFDENGHLVWEILEDAGILENRVSSSLLPAILNEVRKQIICIQVKQLKTDLILSAVCLFSN